MNRVHPRKTGWQPLAWILLLGIGGAAPAFGQASAPARANPCGELANHYGPFDYRVNRGLELKNVEIAHFSPLLEALIKPMQTTKNDMAGDVGYTLRAFPNHHRALLTMQRLGEVHKTDNPPSSGFSVECYFNRATRFAPDDTVVRMLYAQYLGKKKRVADAQRQLEIATEYAKDDGFAHHNIGLVYFELGNFDKALQQAHKARELGFDRPDLAELLKRENKWQEPAGG